MNLLWLQDLPFVHDGGGSQLTDRRHYLTGVRRGHAIDTAIGGARFWLDGVHDARYAGVILSNVTAFPWPDLHTLAQGKVPYVVFAHDYACRWRLYYPLADRCRDCYLRDRWLPLLLGARLVVFLSPLHRKAWRFAYPELSQVPTALVPSPVDPTQFPVGTGPRAGAISVNGHLPFKGRERFFAWAQAHPDVPITLVGPVAGEEAFPPNIHAIGEQPYAAMPALYQRHEVFLDLPETPQPFNRTVAEAYLSGCRVEGNALVGALSWPFFKHGREAVARACAGAPVRFWRAVEGALR